ncbi:unnamed protein product [Discosporangium mesarthrocarpum]
MSLTEGLNHVSAKLGGLAATLALTTLVAVGSPGDSSAAETLPAGTNPLNSICMGFGCGEYRGLDYSGAPAPTDEESIPFTVFLDVLNKGGVEKVEFFSGGDKAYAFLRPTSGPANGAASKRIRIGEGWPEEKGNSWSSPLWVVRALNDRSVPYKFMYDLGGKTRPLAITK